MSNKPAEGTPENPIVITHIAGLGGPEFDELVSQVRKDIEEIEKKEDSDQ